MQAKPSINIKNSIDYGHFDYSERGVRGNGGEVQPFHGTCGCPPCQAGRQVFERVDGQPRGMPTAQHQSANLADAARQRYAGLFTNQPQGVLQARGRDAHRKASRTQTGEQNRLITIVPLNPT